MDGHRLLPWGAVINMPWRTLLPAPTQPRSQSLASTATGRDVHDAGVSRRAARYRAKLRRPYPHHGGIPARANTHMGSQSFCKKSSRVSQRDPSAPGVCLACSLREAPWETNRLPNSPLLLKTVPSQRQFALSVSTCLRWSEEGTKRGSGGSLHECTAGGSGTPPSSPSFADRPRFFGPLRTAH